MILKLLHKDHFVRIIICGILTTTILFQVVTPALNLGFDIEQNIEWSDGSDTSETDKLDVEEIEYNKDFNPQLMVGYRSSSVNLTDISYQQKKHLAINIDIYLPPPRYNPFLG
jgi:hypothetical protein